MVSRFAAFVIWAAVAASAVFWAMRLWATPIAAPAHATVVSAASGFNGDLSRLFGADSPAPAVTAAAPQLSADPRFRLIGVVAPRAAAARAEGLALIATDGKPAKAYRVGTPVDGELVLLDVHARGASLGPRGQPAQLALELPPRLPPSTGTPGAPLPGNPLPRAGVMLPQPQAMPMAPAPQPIDRDEPEPAPETTTPSSVGRPPT